MRSLPFQAASGPGGLLTLLRTESTFERLRGLLGRPPLSEREALLIDPCNSVHTLGMRYPIDVVFLDARDRIVKISPALGPGRIAGCWAARRVIELRGGGAGRLGWRTGQWVDLHSEEPV